jgi:hypothetical protein
VSYIRVTICLLNFVWNFQEDQVIILKKRLESLKSKVIAAEQKPIENKQASNDLEDLETENVKLKYQINQLKRVSTVNLIII